MSDTSKRRGRRTVARHGRLGAANPFSRLLRVVGIGLACVLVAGVGVAGYAAWDLGSAFSENAVDIHEGTTPPDIGQLSAEEGVDLLLTGIDICEWDSHEKFGDRCPTNPDLYGPDGRELEAGRNDVNLLVHISPEPRKVTAITLPRDLMMATPECTNAQGRVTPASDKKMINTAYEAGGLACVVRTVDSITTQYNPDLAIEYAATVTWNGVIEITNAIGGVDVCVGETIDDVEAGMLHLEGGQTHNLQGEQALAFLRSRYGVGGSDLARISNQQVYMASLARKLTSEQVLTNPGTLLSLARTTLTNVDPSSNLTNPATLVQIAMAVKDVPTSDITFLQLPVLDDPYDKNRVVPDDAGVEEMFAAIKANESADPAAPSTEATGTPAPTETPGATETPDPGLAAPGRTAEDEGCANSVG
ncbi:LytR family transcriptional regulator [Microbacterium paludicola]|uniref:LytR family transcriptional regulator n=1 Tax=Microbacterium paludicola TaxID=300019 RepID=A0A4Y9FVH9_9MICO|nr:LCP family protein [Microbacterium paludicola]MBF0816062.1 LCP family protein [Microbacterium paludicola]TFU33249.1 LytR family transcriptional regulator [Microbacterium paludicola]